MTPASLIALFLLAGPSTASVPGEAPVASPSPFTVQSRTDKREVKLGQPFRYEIEVRHGKDVTVSLPATLPQEPFRMDEGSCREEDIDAERTTTCTLTVSLFALGPNDLPELDLLVKGPTGPTTLKVSGPRVTGLGLIDPNAPAEKLKLRDLAPPAPLFVRSYRLLYLLLAALLALILVFVTYRLLLRMRARAVEPPAPLPPHERFQRRLDELETARLGERGHEREHFYRLSEIVREYLGSLLGSPALDLTTEELLLAVHERGDPRLEPQWLRPFLCDMDLVKFARAPAGPGECASGLAFARGLLERTRPPELPALAPAQMRTGTEGTR